PRTSIMSERVVSLNLLPTRTPIAAPKRIVNILRVVPKPMNMKSSLELLIPLVGE
ncbi:MAG: hypothetical protein RJB59_541, partial [Actinomycetota bacterium]